MTSELLDDYEEGTWTPVITSSTGSFTTVNNIFGRYTKTGRQVTLIAIFTVAAIGTAGGFMTVSGVPFTTAIINSAGSSYNRSQGVSSSAAIDTNGTSFTIFRFDNASPIVNGSAYTSTLTYFV
jgi:hypothetical protein